MGQKKISQLPQDSLPTVTDSIPTYDVETTLTKRSLISDLITLFFNNIPTGSASPITRWSEVGFDHVASGLVWTGDALGSTRAASMTSGTCYINGRRITLSAVTSRTFTASKDTYIDVLDNLDGTGTIVYTEASNNAASSSLASNSIRIGIIVTGGTTIAAAGSINQGQENKILPIASSIPYAVTDSIGNLICPRDPNRRILGYRQILTTFTTSSTGSTDITGLSAPVIVPAGRKIKITIDAEFMRNSSASAGTSVTSIIAEGATALNDRTNSQPSANYALPAVCTNTSTPSAGAHTYKAQGSSNGIASTYAFSCGATAPAFILIELV